MDSFALLIFISRIHKAPFFLVDILLGLDFVDNPRHLVAAAARKMGEIGKGHSLILNEIFPATAAKLKHQAVSVCVKF